MRRLALVIAFLTWATAGRAQPLVTDLSSYHIAITSRFTGTELLLFGALGRTIDPQRADLIVVIRGPDLPAIVRRRARRFGIWINAESVRFESAPGYYLTTSTRPLDQLVSPQLLARNQIGISHLKLELVPSAPAEALSEPRIDEFREALIRAKKREGLYRQDVGNITFISQSLFRVAIQFPSNVPIGDYRVETYLVIDGEIRAAQSSPLFIAKAGIEREVFVFAHRQALAYGLTAIAIALGAGWAAGEFFRKN